MDDDLAPFESPKLLIDGAKTNIVDFESACSSFIENCVYDVISDDDLQAGQHVIKLRFRNRVPPRLRLLASHIINDLRHALDQATCDGALRLGRANAKGVYFPFGKTPQDLDSDTKAKTRNVDPDLVSFIRSFEAHYAGDGLLYALSALAGPNKHQRILTIAMEGDGFMLSNTDILLGPRGIEARMRSWNNLRNELEIVRIGIGSSGNFDLSPVLHIVLGRGEPPLSDPAPTVLRAFASKVESVVLGIEAETSRILQARTA